ncbi:luciferase [Pasteurellaceae bacterium RH1A]|nr:luciferase [Pasteurellaceae bacterium RH1A]
MKVSILDLVPRRQGETYQAAMHSMVELAQYAESIGIERYWIAEHHNTKNLASSATQLLIQQALAHTQSLRVGSGGVMLPNHSPYIVAEQYGTLETLFPGRVELGLGRAPGTDMQTARALRRDRLEADFADEIAELRGYFDNTNPVSAYPAAGLNLPFYILGSSAASAYLAAELGLPYAFASHFAPRMLEMAVEIYRSHFKPSAHLAQPYVIMGANVIVAESDEEAQKLATTTTQFFLNVVTNAQEPLKPPVASNDEIWLKRQKAQGLPHFGPVDFHDIPIYSQERAVVEQMLGCSLIGSPESVAAQLTDWRGRVAFDEVMAVSYIFDKAKQRESYRLFKEIMDKFQS